MSANDPTNGRAPQRIGQVLGAIPVQPPPDATPKQPGWKRRPDHAGQMLEFQVFRVPPKGAKNLIILSHDIVGADTHYYRSRTRVCMGEWCAACREGLLPRWRGYVFALKWDAQTVVLLELTGPAVAPLQTWFCAHRTLRECTLDLIRMRDAPNGRLIATNLRKYSQAAPLPRARSIKDALTRLWRLNDQESAELARNEDLGLAPDEVEPPPQDQE